MDRAYDSHLVQVLNGFSRLFCPQTIYTFNGHCSLQEWQAYQFSVPTSLSTGLITLTKRWNSVIEVYRV